MEVTNLVTNSSWWTCHFCSSSLHVVNRRTSTCSYLGYCAHGSFARLGYTSAKRGHLSGTPANRSMPNFFFTQVEIMREFWPLGSSGLYFGEDTLISQCNIGTVLKTFNMELTAKLRLLFCRNIAKSMADGAHPIQDHDELPIQFF